MSSLTVEEDQKWFPTHVQVTVLRGRGVRGKGKHGTSDVYTIIQLGREKYSTCVAEKTTEPEWREECSFELQPGVLETGCPAGSNELVLVAMHRAPMGLDVFLGQAVIQLDKVFHQSRCVRNEWYKLNSKTGKKEKERGDIQVTVQFTRNNLTASMYDLVMKDKGASTFGKLKERIKGKKRCGEEDSAPAALPSGYGSLVRMRQRLPSDGGGEEDYEDDEGGEARRSKMRTFFLRGKLRKSSDTRSSTSLGSESSESSSRGGSLSPTAGISVVVSDLSNSPSNSSNLTADNSPDHTKSSSLICEFGDDDDGEITIAVPRPAANGRLPRGVRPTDPGKPAAPSGLAPLQRSLPLSVSLQNLRPSTDLLKSPAGDGRRWSFDKPCEEEKAAIAAALEQSGPMLGDEEEEEEEEEEGGQFAPPGSAASSRVESGKKPRSDMFTQRQDESQQAGEQKHKGWFGSKDSHGKPSARPPIAKVFPQTRADPPAEAAAAAMDEAGERPFEGGKPASVKLPGAPARAGEVDPDSEWDECFDAFAAGRLQSPEDPTAGKTQRSDALNADDGASLPATEANANEALRRRPSTGSAPDAQRAVFQVTGTYHSDTFAQFLETIPEHESFDSDNVPLSNSPDAWLQANQANSATNDLNHTNAHRAPSGPPFVELSSSSPDPGSSGIGSSEAEEEFVSCPSSFSDKFCASSSEEAEVRLVDSDILRFERSSDPSVVRPSESEDDTNDRSADLSAADVGQRTVIQHGESSESSPAPQTPPLAPQQHEINGAPPSPNLSGAERLPELQPKSKEPSQFTAELDGSAQDFFDTFAPVSDTAGVMTFTTPEGTLAHPSLRIITSSPEASLRSPNPFGFVGDLLNASNMASGPGRDLGGASLAARASDQSGSSVFLQSFSASTDSQDYQTCASHQTSKCSSGPELNETPRSANSTLCGELSDTHATSTAAALGLDGSTDAYMPRGEGFAGWDRSAEDVAATLEPCFGMAEAFGSPPASCNLETLAEGGDGSRRVVSGDASPKRREAPSAPLNRSHSEGELTPAFDGLLRLPSFGSDPGATQEAPPPAQPGPRLPSLTSFAPCLTPQSSSSPVARFSLPPPADAAARPPPPPPRPVHEEPPTRQQHAANQENSPHPVKPLSAAPPAEERRTEGRSVLEKLKSSIHPGRSSEQEADRKKPVTEGAGSYYHLNHRELVAMLVEREAELERQKAEFERQKLALAKREVELRKLKPQVKDLEDYIDTLLVRIMEQKPTLLQVRSKLK
ncbi:uncharacterized protein rab11fip5a isoform X2 [Gasterosteus aculeatus]